MLGNGSDVLLSLAAFSKWQCLSKMNNAETQHMRREPSDGGDFTMGRVEGTWACDFRLNGPSCFEKFIFELCETTVRTVYMQGTRVDC